MINTKFSNFLRHGGNGTASLAPIPSGGMRLQLALKADVPGYRALKTTFEANLQRADLINRTLVLRFSAASFTPPLTETDLADVRGDMDAALMEWEQRIGGLWRQWETHPDRFTERRRAMELTLIASFAGLINERRQRALGIDQYVWRSKDDAKVRHSHGKYDDQVFDWDSPPEGGHPGQAYNCRCFAEPLVLDVPEYVPLTDAEFLHVISEAELDGNELATDDAIASLYRGLLDVPGFIHGADRYLELRDKEKSDALTDAERQELAELQTLIDARLKGIEAVLSDLAGAVTQSWLYRKKISAQADAVAIAYLEGRATEGQLITAYRDKGYADRSFFLGVLPFVTALRLPSVRGRSMPQPTSENLKTFWRDQSGAVRVRPIGSDWPIDDNAGIHWGGPIKQQGGPWEEMLQGRYFTNSYSLHPNFMTFDRQSFDLDIATSAKTLNTMARGYRARPSRIYGRLKRYINQIDVFEKYELAGDRVLRVDLVERHMQLAIPIDTTPAQYFHIQRAIDYAADRGIIVTVTRIR